MKKFKSLGDVYTEARSYEYKDSTSVQREVDKISKAYKQAKVDLLAKENEVDANMRSNRDIEPQDWDRLFRQQTSEERKATKRLEKQLDDAIAKYRTARNLENPTNSPTLSDEYESMKQGKHRLKGNYGAINSLSHNYATYNELSKDGKRLYEGLREYGNRGETKEFGTKADIDEIESLGAKELGTVMMLALDMGYELDMGLYYRLEELSPSMSKKVNSYDGYKMSHTNNMRASHAHYTKIRNQYLNKYDGDEVKADRMTKLYRKRKQAESKFEQKYKN